MKPSTEKPNRATSSTACTHPREITRARRCDCMGGRYHDRAKRMRAKHLAEVRALRLVGVGHNHPPGAVLGQVEQVEGREPRARRGAGQASSASSSSALLLDPLTAARSQMRTTRARSFRGVRADARAGQPGIRGKRPAMAEGGDGHFGLSRQAGLVAAPGCRSGDHTPLHVQVRPLRSWPPRTTVIIADARSRSSTSRRSANPQP
jgi:hypothetical protein